MTLLLLLSLLGSPAKAQVPVDIGKATKAPVASLPDIAELNQCKPQADLQKQKTEEDFARAAAEKNNLSNEEILARLIFSESLSTGYWHQKCQAANADDIMKAVGWGVMNRVKTKLNSSLDGYYETIFAHKQFRTSFSEKDHNAFAEAFLCPLHADAYLKAAPISASAQALFSRARQISHQIIADYEQSGIPNQYKGMTNFFYPQSEFFGDARPKWAPKPVAADNRGYMNVLGVAKDPCVEAYHL